MSAKNMNSKPNYVWDNELGWVPPHDLYKEIAELKAGLKTANENRDKLLKLLCEIRDTFKRMGDNGKYFNGTVEIINSELKTAEVREQKREI